MMYLCELKMRIANKCCKNNLILHQSLTFVDGNKISDPAYIQKYKLHAHFSFCINV